ncbi:MAG: hypothetical protein V4710_12245 [Verrucomicrobiota bacterium]
MPERCVFHIRPLSIENGFTLDCEGVISNPLKRQRLYEAVITAAQIGKDLNGEIQIFDSVGSLAEVLPLCPGASVSG